MAHGATWTHPAHVEKLTREETSPDTVMCLSLKRFPSFEPVIPQSQTWYKAEKVESAQIDMQDGPPMIIHNSKKIKNSKLFKPGGQRSRSRYAHTAGYH